MLLFYYNVYTKCFHEAACMVELSENCRYGFSSERKYGLGGWVFRFMVGPPPLLFPVQDLPDLKVACIKRTRNLQCLTNTKFQSFQLDFLVYQ